MKIHEENYLIENYSSLGPTKCSIALNLPKSKVAYEAKRLKLKVDKKYLSNIMKELRDKELKDFNVDSETFLDIDCTVKAYLLGLLWGDGYIKCSFYQDCREDSIVFSTTFPDGDEFLSQFIKVGKWNVYKSEDKKHPTWKTRVIISTSNKHITKKLFELGYKEKNMGFEKILDYIPNNFIHSFLLGLSDSDGCFFINEKRGMYSFSYCSCYDQDWSVIENLLSTLKIEFKIERQKTLNGNYSKLHVKGKSRVKMWGEFLYQSFDEDKIGLLRKYTKYKDISEKCDKWVRKCTLPNYVTI